MFFITGYAHRGLSHRSYEAGRAMLFWMGLAHTSAVNSSPLWWAAHHRHHHEHSDEEDDVHSPVSNSFLHAHFLWIFDPENKPMQADMVQDLIRECPELLWFEHRAALYAFPIAILCAAGFAGMIFGIPWWFGALMSVTATFFLHQSIYTINSINHVWGRRRFDTGDRSTNNWLTAILTLGEGWHNNHHFYQKWSLAFQTWKEFFLDITWQGLRIHDRLGLIRIPDHHKKIARGIWKFGSYQKYKERQLEEFKPQIEARKAERAEKSEQDGTE